MGASYKYICHECGYTTMVSGGRDVGMEAVVRTMICSNCQELVDVLIGREGNDGPTGDPDYDKDLNICPDCHGLNIQPWPDNHPCPRCSHKMIKSEEPPILWD